jgi:predicted LPLAT superfamily acyltransferase
MVSQWDGKSKGTLLGYKIFVNCIKTFGVRTSYLVLIFVSFYYFLFSPKSNRSLFYYLRKRLQFSWMRSFFGLYRSYFTFGKTLIDKVAITSGLRNRYTYEFDGIDILKQLLAEKKGGILISAHVGNFEVAEHFFEDINLECRINLVTADLEETAISEYLKQVARQSNVKLIKIKDDMSHIFDISNALSNNELICFTGDRYFEENKLLSAQLLGEEALFPAGPFRIASRLGVPVVFVYVMKEPGLHYHLYARRADVKHRDAESLLKSYCQSLEKVVKRYPYQWYNFFDFWKKLNA